MGLLFFGPFHFLHVDLNFSISLVGKIKDILKILEFVPKLRDGIDPPEGHRQPVQELGLAPAPSDPFHPIRHPAERRLGDVRRERDPLLMVQPVIEKRQRLPREVQKARSRFRITALRQRRQQLAKAAPDRSRELPHQRLVLGFQRFQLRLPEVEEGIAVQKLQELPLGRSLDLIGVEKKTKIVMAMPDATPALHPCRTEVVLDARPAVGKQHPQTPIVQTATEVPEVDPIVWTVQRPSEGALRARLL